MPPSRTLLAMLLLSPVLTGCTRCSEVSGPAEPVEESRPEVAAPPLTTLPMELRVEQRSTTEVPGSDGGLRLTIDDITRGRVMTSLIGVGGEPVLGPLAFAEHDAAKFTFRSHRYELRLHALDNALLGDDFAVFVIAEAAEAADPPVAAALAEEEKIEALIAHIAGLEGGVFIRNGSEHAAAEAAAHLRRKREAAGERITSAAEFINHIATESSITGRAYRIRLADGREVLAGAYLHERLEEIEGGARADDEAGGSGDG